jgi:hypothetical protein
MNIWGNNMTKTKISKMKNECCFSKYYGGIFTCEGKISKCLIFSYNTIYLCEYHFKLANGK